jgi:hypothetical protein
MDQIEFVSLSAEEKIDGDDVGKAMQNDAVHPCYAPNAQHWPITARHEAGHAVAAIVMFRQAGWHWDAFDRVFIRPGAIKPYIDERGRACDCVGMVERPSRWNAGMLPGDCLRDVEPWVKEKCQLLMSIEVISNLAGPFAQARAMGRNSRVSARWDALFSGGCGDEYGKAEATISDMRAMARRGSLRKFEAQTFDLVKQYWPAIDALGERLLKQHSLEYDEAEAVVEPLLGGSHASLIG